MKKEKIIWKFSPQKMTCMICEYHQAIWILHITEPLKFNAIACSVCAKLSEKEIANKLFRGKRHDKTRTVPLGTKTGNRGDGWGKP